MNVLNVVGRILSLTEKKSANGSFYIVDLETFYGPNIRFQAWGNAYTFIKRNQLRSAEDSEIADYLEVEGYTHNYLMTIKGNTDQFVTFKTQKVRRPSARVTYTGKVDCICEQDLSAPDEINFYFVPDVKCVDSCGNTVRTSAIACSVVLAPGVLDTLTSAQKNKGSLLISGVIDNTNKKQSIVQVEEIKEVPECK